MYVCHCISICIFTFILFYRLHLSIATYAGVIRLSMSSQAVCFRNLNFHFITFIESYCSYLFWSDWNRDAPVIERANLDGTGRTVLVEDGLGLPNGLTIDYSLEKICWADAGMY